MGKEERIYGVYKHTAPSSKIYIGITKQKPISKRWRNGRGYKNQYFDKAIKKYRVGKY